MTPAQLRAYAVAATDLLQKMRSKLPYVPREVIDAADALLASASLPAAASQPTPKAEGYSAAYRVKLESEFLGPVEKERLGRAPAWVRSVVSTMLLEIENLRAKVGHEIGSQLPKSVKQGIVHLQEECERLSAASVDIGENRYSCSVEVAAEISRLQRCGEPSQACREAAAGGNPRAKDVVHYAHLLSEAKAVYEASLRIGDDLGGHGTDPLDLPMRGEEGHRTGSKT